MRSRRSRVPVLASLFSVIAILVTAGVAFACSPPSIAVGTCQYNVQTGANEHHWTLTPDAGYVKIMVSVASDHSSPVYLTLTQGHNYDYVTPATVSTLYVRLDPAGNYGGDESWESKAWSGACPTAPTISTQLSETKGHIGDSVHDTAILGLVAPNTAIAAGFTGTVKYTVYRDADCDNKFADAGTKTIANGAVPPSDNVTFNSAGTWYWQAVYSGDANHKGATSACVEEKLTIDPNQETGIATVPVDENTDNNAQTPPDKVHDTATLTGVTATAGGTVTYTLFSCGTDEFCASPASPQVGGTKPVTNGVVTKSDTITLTDAGYYCWMAVYSGDTDNAGATSKCTDEIILVAVQHEEGQTATPVASNTPPPTSTGGGSGSSTTPLLALLICFAFGALGLTAVEAQRRSIRR